MRGTEQKRTVACKLAFAEPVRERVKEMFAKYRPPAGLGNGDGQSMDRVAAENARLVPIERKPGDERKAELTEHHRIHAR